MATAEIEPRDVGGGEAAGGGGAFSSLAHRNFRLFWAGAFLSNTGTWMQTLAQGWLMLLLTNSAFWLGFDGFAATAPGLVLLLLGGVFADIFDRKRLLIVSQIVAGATALVLALLIWTDVIHFTMILAASFVTGCCFALASPSYQAITIDLVGRRDLSNAIALNSAQFQLSRVLGPALAGIAFKFLGVAGCFLINGLSYVAIVASLMMVRIPKNVGAAVGAADAAGSGAEVAAAAPRPAVDRRSVWRDIKEGFRYVLGRPRVLTLLSISAVTSLFGAPYMTMMPIFARDILKLDASGLSILMGTAGAGSFCAAVLLALLGNVPRKGWFVLGGSFMFGACVVGFALWHTLGAALVFLFLIGFGIVSSVAVVNILIQQLITDEMRGRVMSMFMLSFFGAFPIGNYAAGVAAERFGAPHTLAAGGVITALFVVLVAAFNPRLRAMD
ncbi:MAG TPA: MFS transporter [Pyrinomonadaceae bacterium]|jgi:MFS family permease|nr:MFS transporter [Pyrinomonadaceae bacterium]